MSVRDELRERTDMFLKRARASAEHDVAFESEKWMGQIPYIPIPAGWEIQPIPPFGCAVVRFVVKKGEHTISVYLDCYGLIGAWNRPYWEIYPGANPQGEPERIAMEAVDELLYQLSQSFIQMGDEPSTDDPPKPTTERKPVKKFNRFEHIEIVQRDENNDEISTGGQPDQTS